ncbi:MAG: ABC transporter ATP-binding protein [Dehalococcoidia bacterium]|nr:MAG: peptide ABC transporter ATP-binding protein [Chloroflexi bacterium TMED230]RZP14394.1 MAG: dipeptide ABC transporter ATP-binding protein [Chloroflexota bacterium]|tara:strand:- start:10066 stop:11088 length:1023 start_codon:yes stop_codon:yes gene_type:complete
MSATKAKNENIIEIKNLKKYYPLTSGLMRKVTGMVKAVDDVSFVIPKGKTVGLVGESGCGKTTISKCILRAVDPTEGEIYLNNEQGTHDLANLSDNELRPLRKEMQMIFQDPFSSLNPRMNLFDIVSEPLLLNGIKNRTERQDRVEELLIKVGLRSEYMIRFPHAFSGGQRQRIGIARALALNPSLIVCDEPVSGLDVSVQAQVINLLMDLQDEFGLSYLFVSHDLSIVRQISDEINVMYLGRLVENGTPEQIFSSPKHPYTEALISAVPQADPDIEKNHKTLIGEIPNPSNPPSGCYFHPRCAYATDECKITNPELTIDKSGRTFSCHNANNIKLAGLI